MLQTAKKELDIETHPWAPFVPQGAEYLIMGTFPPAPNRWSMDFYYPNAINDFWRIMGLIYLGDKDALWDANAKAFRLDEIKALMTEKKIALHDTVRQARRLMGNASDKFLEVVEPVRLRQLIDTMPSLRAIATTGEKAAKVIAELTGTEMPKMGECVVARGLGATGADIAIWRMPSTSRAYPMKLEAKAAFYKRLLQP